jgi:hypothetical protein
MALSPPISQEQRRRQRRKIPQFAVVTRRNQCRELLAHDTLHGEKLSIGRNEVKRRDFSLAIGAARKDQTTCPAFVTHQTRISAEGIFQRL